MHAPRRLCVAVDLEGFSARAPHAQALLQHRLRRLLKRAWRECGVRPERVWQGDGEVALAPRGIDESALVSGFCRALRIALRRTNRDLAAAAEPERVRVRVAMHTGAAAVGRPGLVGAGVVRACRLLDSPQLRAALAGNRRTDFALMVSQSLFEDVIGAEEHELTRADFAPARVVLDAKCFTADAWVHVADRLPADGGDLAGLLATLLVTGGLGPQATQAGVFGSAGAGSRVNVASQNHRVGDSTDSAVPAS